MHPLLRKSLLRFGLLHAYALLVAWIFTLIERRDEPSYKRMQKSLKELRIDMDLKYNITDEDFDSFVKRAVAAVTEGDKLDWTLLNSLTFALAAFTTIGKCMAHVCGTCNITSGFTGTHCVSAPKKSARLVFGVVSPFLAIREARNLVKNSRMYMYTDLYLKGYVTVHFVSPLQFAALTGRAAAFSLAFTAR